MPNDFLTLNALTNELNEALSGGKIEKIHQPEKDEIVLIIRSKGEKRMLAVSCCAESPRIHLTERKKENPMQAPAFCMHLRKLAGSGYIDKIKLVNNDRIISIDVLSKNELKDTVKYSVIFEMMGRYSNILVINEKNYILDAVKQVSFDTATKRAILPGAIYAPPQQSKILPFDYEEIENRLTSIIGGGLSKFLSANISGLSPVSAEEIVLRSGADDRKRLCSDDIRSLIETYKKFYAPVNAGIYSPCTCKIGNSEDYFITEYASLNGEFTAHDTLSAAIERCMLTKDGKERHREKTKHLANAVKKYKSRNLKKLQKANEKLEECSKIDIYLKYGELLNCNLYRIEKGSDKVTVDDYYEENSPKITIPLDPLLSAGDNAQAYFKKYRKLKRTLEVIVKQIEETEECLKYADSVSASLNTSASASEQMQIEEELYAAGALKKMKTKKYKSMPKAEPYLYEFMDYAVMAGKNNIQNDKLTFKTANGGDMWLHALDYHGSHVIIFSEGRDSFPDEIIIFAAELAAFYSDAAGDAITVDYTLRRNVKRNPSGKPGMVTYTEQKSVKVKADKHESNMVNKENR